MGETAAALAGSLVLAGAYALTPAIARLPERYLASLDSFSGGTGLAYMFLYLLFELAKYGAPKIHALLPLGPEPLETLFILLLGAISTNYLLQVHLAKSPSRQDDYQGFAALFLFYNFLAGAGVVEEAHAGSLNLGIYVTALALHLLFNDLFLLHLCPDAHHWRWRTALAAMPVIGCALAVGFVLPEGVLYGMLALIAGSTIINVVRHELPHPKSFRSGAFVTGVIVYAALIIATWRI
ncbi:MAG TPA: hypothetical protein VJ577_09900 [Burkholderiaceae bacterium]|nr:hypothetical protein [Burkholderiaceae bacterium]